MALTVNWSAEIDPSGSTPLVIGDGTAFEFPRRGGIDGLGNPPPRTRDANRGDLDGDVAGVDRYDPRRIRFAIEVAGDPTTVVYPAVRDLKAAWRARSAETVLDVRLPWFETTNNILRFYGRPRPLELDITSIDFGLAPVLATFDALDPFGYGPLETVSDSSSPAAVTSAGDVPTDRFTITVVGNGGTPVITSTTDDNSVVSFAAGFSGTAVLDFRAHTVTVASVDSYDLLAAGPRWFRLLPGANNLTFTGCASIQVDHRPAYL